MRLMAAAGAAVLLLAETGGGLFSKDNLIAWCIVPFDARHRGPEERARMLESLGIRHFAYDWRDKDMPTFDAELDALNRHGISLDAFWLSYPANGQNSRWREVRDFLKRRGVRTGIWLSLAGGAAFEALPHGEKLRVAAEAVSLVAREAGAIGCRVGLYNHGGWFGEPENQMEVLRRAGLANVGIVYNLHHAHAQLDRLPQLLALMKPRLMAINLNGMKAGGPQILPVGEGDRDLEVLQAIQASGYRGPIGILGHREELDAEEALKLNLAGLERLARRLR